MPTNCSSAKGLILGGVVSTGVVSISPIMSGLNIGGMVVSSVTNSLIWSSVRSVVIGVLGVIVAGVSTPTPPPPPSSVGDPTAGVVAVGVIGNWPL